ncbi:MAG: hypothetical protein H0X42_07305 [Solirubrobacterales bacterium]|nr:hypothetical protein [Solirubrobacterales bacterium]
MQVVNSQGGVGEAFGGAGSLTLPPAAGDKFELGDFTIDPHGRLLVVGTSLFPESENPSPFLENGSRAFRPRVLRILRFLPGGHLDPTFGQGGVVETDLGLPPPLGTDGEPLGTHPSVYATGLAVDPQGEIVVTGGAVVRLGESCEHDSFAPVAVSAGFVARLTGSGAPDPGFGDDGLVGGRDLGENPLGAETIGDPVVGPGGGITYLSSGAYVCERGRSHLGVAQLTPNGRTRKAFGKRGAIVGRFKALVAGSHGSVFALAEEPRHEKDPVKARLLRIAPNGGLDRTFGQHGQTTVKLGPSFATTLDSLAVDGRGRILVGGTLGSPEGRSIVLLRVSARGGWETNFGPHGRVATRVRHLARFGSSDLFFDPKNRLVTVHQYAEALRGRSGLVVARYLLP